MKKDKEIISPILGEGFVKKTLARYNAEEISFGKFVELLNEHIPLSSLLSEKDKEIERLKGVTEICPSCQDDESKMPCQLCDNMGRIPLKSQQDNKGVYGELLEWIENKIWGYEEGDKKFGKGTSICNASLLDNLRTVKEKILSLSSKQEIKSDLETLFERHAQWASKKFPDSTYLSSLIGLKREVDEAMEEMDRNKLGLEYADIQFYFIDSLKRAGFTIDDLKIYETKGFYK